MQHQQQPAKGNNQTQSQTVKAQQSKTSKNTSMQHKQKQSKISKSIITCTSNQTQGSRFATYVRVVSFVWFPNYVLTNRVLMVFPIDTAMLAMVSGSPGPMTKKVTGKPAQGSRGPRSPRPNDRPKKKVSNQGAIAWLLQPNNQPKTSKTNWTVIKNYNTKNHKQKEPSTQKQKEPSTNITISTKNHQQK